MVPLLTVERGVIGVGGFVLLLLIESVWPFRRPADSRWRRYAINLFITGSNALLLSVLLGGLIIAAYRAFELHRLGLLLWLGIGGWGNVFVTVVILDGVTYAWHRAYHGLPLLWRMHRVHHSDRDVDVTTSGRFHLTEMVLSAIFRLGVIAALGASVAGVVIFEIVFGLLNQAEHSNLKIPEPFETWLRWIFVTPDMHRIHHSQEQAHTNSNYSTIFSFWDRWGGTYVFGPNQQRLTIGLPEYPRAEHVTFGKVLAMPFGPPCGAGHQPARRLRPVWKLAGFLLIIGGFLAAHHARVSASKPLTPARQVEIVYQARLSQVPPDARDVHLWIPLAKTRAEQRVTRRDIDCPVPYAVAEDPDYGNEILHLSLTPPIPQPFEVRVRYEVILLGPQPGEESPPNSSELARWLQPDQLVVIDDEVQAKASLATEGRRTVWDRARGIYDYVIRHMAYDKTTAGWGRGDTRRACLLGKGNCTDFHSLFISMARAQRIPARFKIGTLIPDAGAGMIPGYHCWAEFYLEGTGWVPVDASEAWKRPELTDYYFGARDGHRWLVSVGRDIRLVPEAHTDPVNILFYPHAEVNDQPFSGVETEIRFQDLEQERST